MVNENQRDMTSLKAALGDARRNEHSGTELEGVQGRHKENSKLTFKIKIGICNGLLGPPFYFSNTEHGVSTFFFGND